MARNHTKNEPIKKGDKVYVVTDNLITKAVVKHADMNVVNLLFYIGNSVVEEPFFHDDVFRTKRELVLALVNNTRNLSKPEQDGK